jgi:hypothetical protein
VVIKGSIPVSPATSGCVMVGAVRLRSIWGAATPTGSRIAVV